MNQSGDAPVPRRARITVKGRQEAYDIAINGRHFCSVPKDAESLRVGKGAARVYARVHLGLTV